jgi:20S proteasome subunit beta 2
MTMLKQYLFQYQGHVGAYLVIGGVDQTGSHLFTVAAHGSTDKLPYVTMGSGSMAAMAVFESSFKEHMTVSYVTIVTPFISGLFGCSLG